MPRSFLVKKHLSYKKPNYGYLDAQKRETLFPKTFENSLIAHISHAEFPPNAADIESMNAQARSPLVSTGLSVTSYGETAEIISGPINMQVHYADPARADQPADSWQHFKASSAALRDTLSNLNCTPFQICRSGMSCTTELFKENCSLPGPILPSEHRDLPISVQGKFQCFDCHKAYYTFSGLAKHRQLQCEWHCRKYFNCKYCDKEYVSLGALKMHIRTHTLPCVCKLCGKAFSRPWLLQGHIRTHTGEKPFACPHCSRAFADRSNLRAHLQTHSDVKKYQCKTCAKTFSRMSLLSKHEEASCCPLS
ncbi:zinc finger protein SNAI2-like [Polypterus senegalus]|uniref:zinc finger protein SNAI2-like n=1 Tax=Polypterus senegalus TaxID=55291 RepID=UPI00196361DB|nr:zinc finger protein SNAI2-like [Polypterus senegalus]